MSSPVATPQKRGSSGMPGHEQHSAQKRARAGVHGSPVVHTLGQSPRFRLDEDADDAVEEERQEMEFMSLMHIKERCLRKCYVDRSPMLMQKMNGMPPHSRPLEFNMNGLFAAKKLNPGTVVAILSHGAVKKTRNDRTVCIGKEQYQQYECPQRRVARIHELQQSQQSSAAQTRLLTELAYAGAVANEADSQDMLNAVIVTLPANPSKRARRHPCTVLITAEEVPAQGEILVDYGDDKDEPWQHRH